MEKETKFTQTELGMIPEDWEEKSISDVAEVVGGGTPSTAELDNFGSDIPWITPKDLSNFQNRYIERGERNITKKGVENSSAKLLPKGAVLLTTRAPVGYLAIAKNEVTTNQGFHSLIPKKVHSDFLYYLLKNKIEFLKNQATGTTFGELSGGRLKLLKFAFPSVPEQHSIAKILSDLDEKIELNQKVNKTLEAIGQVIFKHWFVDFEFPNEEGKPYKSSGGEMVYNEELGKEIPKGWRVAIITEILDFVKGIEPGYDNYFQEKVSENYLSFYRVQDIADYGNKPSIFVDKNLLKGKTFNKDDILISLDGTIGRVFIGGHGGYSSGIRKLVVRENFISKPLILFFLKSTEFQNCLKLFSGNETTIKHAGGAIEHMKFVFEKNICEKFGETINPIFKKTLDNIVQIQTLSQLRDSLLPKLMSGKIRVPVEEMK
jgi:type I restriction enzyme S subunit